MLKRAGALQLVIVALLMLCLPTMATSLAVPLSGHSKETRQLAADACRQTTYAAAWDSIKQNYCHRDKLKSWDSWRHKFDGQIHCDQQLTSAINEMLASLNDAYTFCLNETDIQNSRAKRKERSVTEVRVMPGNIGYIRMDDFSSQSLAGEMKVALRRLGHTDGIVLDLRNNHGGFISAARDIFALVTDSGRFMSFEGFLDGRPDNQTAILERHRWLVLKGNHIVRQKRKPNLTGNKPLLVLVNEDTRSASEMLAGALQDNGRALVVGRQTYGKGVLQDTFPISDRLALKVVTARYFLPLGQNVHERGLAPDIELTGSAQAQLNRAVGLLSAAVAEARGSGRRVLAVLEQSGNSM